MPSEKQIARWTVKGWNDDHIEYEDDEGKYVLYSDHIAALTAAEQAEPAPAARSGAVKDAVSLAACPVGLFFSDDGELCLKTEYGDNDGRIDAYIVSSGEFFWGGAKSRQEQRSVMVRPLCEETILSALEPAVNTSPSHVNETAENEHEPAEPATDAEPFESCPDCAGSGYSNHPDSGQVCYRCNGQGSYTRPPESRLRDALEGLLEVHEALGAGNSYAAKKARAALAQEDGR